MVKYKAAVIGGSGYGANELIRRLLIHPDIDLKVVASIDHVGESIATAHPNLEGLSDLRFADMPPEEAAQDVDVVLLGLPHTVSSQFVPRLMKTGVKRIIDLSGDFRLKDPAEYARYYGTTHPCPELLADAVYGLVELNREAIKNARLIASPGCFATATELSLLPLAKAGLLQGAVRTIAITGSSGSGTAASAGTHHPVRAKNLKTYKPLRHQHVPEIVQILKGAGAQRLALQFAPVSAPLTRGIFTSSFVSLPASVDPGQVQAAFDACYADEPFVRVPKGRLPEVAAVSGSNYAEVGFVCELADDGLTVMTFCAIDNLIKGGAGQAIQSLNVTLGLDEATTLKDAGGYP